MNNQLMHDSVARKIPNIALLCERFGVYRMELFGSAAGSDFDPKTSDFDFLVEMDSLGADSKVRRWINLAHELEELLSRPVDLVNPQYLSNPYFLQAVNSSRTLIYERPIA